MPKDKHILTPIERKGLEDEKRELEGTVRGLEKEGWGTGTTRSIDKDKIKKQINYLDKAIHEGTPTRMKGVTKDKIHREARELADKIQKGMPSGDEMRRPDRHPGSVMKHVMWQKKNAADIERWKQLQRRLDPNDPTTSSVENLRRK